MISTKTDEGLLWQLFCDGDESAFEEIMSQYYRPLFRYGSRIWPDENIVRDCLQEVFADLWVRRSGLKSVQSVNFYLIKAVRNHLLFEKRKLRSNAFLDEWREGDAFISEFSIETELIREEEARFRSAKLESILNALPARQREVIHLKFFEDLSPDQIAEMMGLNRQSVYNLLHETLRKLRGLWIFILVLIFN